MSDLMVVTARPRRWWQRAAVVLVAAACVAGMSGTPAGAHGSGSSKEPVKVITTGLNGPRQVSSAYGTLLVAESDTGQVTAIDPRSGRKRVVVTGLVSPQGVVAAEGRIYIATGAPAPDADPGAPAASGLMVARPGGTPRLFADLTAYELKNNPDGQIQFGPDGAPLDALSNPYYVISDRNRHGFLLVADAGANVVLKVDRKGRIAKFFLPPTITTGACATQPNNTISGFGCDAVPTGLAYGPGGLLYVSALTSEVPGEGRVYVVNSRGTLVKTIKGFSSPTGVAVDKAGTVYVSELLEGAPAGDGPPPDDFDPSTVGQIVKVPHWGARSYAQVTMPSGLLYADGKLWASAWSIAAFMGIADAGQVVTVSKAAFRRAS